MRIAALLSLTLLSACAVDTDNRRQQVMLEASSRGFSSSIDQTSRFKIFSLSKLRDDKAPVHVYIEGDGKAFLANGMISPDPTPMQGTLLELAYSDPAPNIVYIARACQFVKNDPACNEKYWTTGRFAPETIISVNEVMEKYKSREIEIIGYSGGAAVAMFLVPQNSNIRSFRSIAGNIDHRAFTSLHESIPLEDSIDPDPFIAGISNLPQIHFTGADDDIVPSSVAESYRRKQTTDRCSIYYTIENATHSSGWLEKWPDLLKIKPACR